MAEQSAIPKIIHYCWFGGKPLPPLAVKCIDSWKKFLPDYEIKRWDESNFDVSAISYTKHAYEAKKYAFVSDYARFWILYKYGGIYFDTDVEVIKPMNDIIAAGPFMGCENQYNPGATPDLLGVAPGLGLGVNPGLGLYKEILDRYGQLEFHDNPKFLNQNNIVKITTSILCEKGLKNAPEPQKISGVFIYPKEYFCPINYRSKKLDITSKTVSIHHYAESWVDRTTRIKNFICRIIGNKLTATIIKIKNNCCS